MHRIDTPTATADGRFTAGNKTTGIKGTQVSADWLNMVQEELEAVALAGGQVLSKANNGQLLAAIQSLIAGGGVAVQASGVTIADAGEYFASGEVEAALQQLAAKLYAGTINANQVQRTPVALNGTAFSTAADHADTIVEISSATPVIYTVRPDAEFNARIGTAITLVQAGAGKVSIAAGAGVTIRRPAVFNAATLGQEATAVLYKVAANTWRLGGMLEAA